MMTFTCTAISLGIRVRLTYSYSKNIYQFNTNICVFLCQEKVAQTISKAVFVQAVVVALQHLASCWYRRRASLSGVTFLSFR